MSLLLLYPVLTLLAAVSTDAAADALFQKHEWAKAEVAYQQRTAAAPDDGVAWLRLGITLVQLGKGKEAMAPLEKAQKLGAQESLADYQLAQAAALAGDKGRALAILESLVEADYSPVGLPPEQEKAFVSVARDPAFLKLAAAMEANLAPCKQGDAATEYRKFDFWVGDWEVEDKAGNSVGTSRVERILSDCALLETWHGQGGGDGRSLSSWNPGLRHWEQYWTDGQGLPIFFNGSFEEGELRLRADSARRNGARLFRRETYSKLPNGRVRELSESSSDEGRTWQTEFEFYYLKKAAPH
jgi:tetratricopeptide (TPR) repeat protein